MNTPIPENEAFWMVWKEDGPHPTYTHPSYGQAAGEAERLARLHPAKLFIVLKAIRRVRYVDLDTPLTYRELQNLPPEVIAELAKMAAKVSEAEALRPLVGDKE